LFYFNSYDYVDDDNYSDHNDDYDDERDICDDLNEKYVVKRRRR
jgi:hypothetical protein